MLNRGELERRLDPFYYQRSIRDLHKAIARKPHKKLREIARFSSETWDQKSFFSLVFPYIEISEIDTLTGSVLNVHQVSITEAPSRAKMIVRQNDILVSTTRPSRGAITLLDSMSNDIAIASTGFAVIRELRSTWSKHFLLAVLRSDMCLRQMERKSTGGNYPAINQEELGNILIPVLSADLQRQIIDRLAEAYQTKRAQETLAQALLNSIDGYLMGELGVTLPPEPDNTLESRLFRVGWRQVSGGRFDPISLSRERVNSLDALQSGHYTLKPLHSIAIFPKIILTTNSASLPYLGLENIQSNTGFHVETSEKETFGSALFFSEDQVLFPKLRPYLNKVYYANFDGLCSTEFVVIQPKPLLNSAFLAEFLRSRAVISQTKHLSSGNTLPRLQTDDTRKLLIPVPPLAVQEQLVTHINALRQQAQALRQQAQSEFAETKQGIERLILG